MRNMRKLSILLALCLVLALLPVTSANAAEGGSLWLRYQPSVEGVEIHVCTDTNIASGVITVTYDASILEFAELLMSETFVQYYAVNAQEAGTIKISWIGTGVGAENPAWSLMTLKFAGVADQSATMTGTVYDFKGNTLAITTLNLTGATAAVMQAETLKAEDYTAESFAAMQAALQEAEALLAMETVTQAQLDAATQALVTAMENLVVYTPEPPPTEPPATEPAPTDPAPTEPAPTEPAPTEPTQPGSTAAKPNPTQPSTQEPTIAPKQDNSWMLIALAAVLVVAVVAAVVILKKRGKK